MSLNHRSTTWILVLTSLGFFMAMMDAMIVTTAATAIRTDFHIPVSALQWALNAYNVTIAAVLLIGVSFGERYGRRKIYRWGLFIFTLGSVFCALAPNLPLLVAARIVEGVGASVMTPLSMAILTNALPIQQRGKALGIWSGIGGLALIIGPSLGGWLVATLTWPWIFWINVPVGLLTIILAQKWLPESRGNGVTITFRDAVALIGTTAGTIWALTALTTTRTPWLPGLILLGSLVLGGRFIYRQRFVASPLIPLTAFRSSVFTGANGATFLLYAAMYGVIFFLPQFLQVVGGGNPLQVGLEILPWTGTLVLVAPFAGRAVDRFGERRIASLGLCLQGVGYLLIVELTSPTSTYPALVLPLMIAGSGLSLAGPALQKAVLGAVDRSLIGQTSGIYNLFRLFGGAVGTAISVGLFYQFGSSRTLSFFTAGFHATMVGAAGLSLLGILLVRPLKTLPVVNR